MGASTPRHSKRSQRQRAARGSSRAYQRADGRYAASLEMPRPVGAKRHRVWFYADSPAEAEALRDEAAHDLKAGRQLPDRKTALGDVLARWLGAIPPGTRTSRSRAGIKHSTWVAYEGHVRNHIGPLLGRTPIGTLTTADVEHFMTDRLATGYEPRTVEYMWITLKAALSWAVGKGIVHSNVAAAAVPPAVQRIREVPPFRLAETRAMLDAFSTHRLESLYVVAATVGPRQGELLSSSWSDFDEERGTLTLRHTLEWVDGGAHLGRTKTDRGRTVTLPRLALDALDRWRECQKAERAKALLEGKPWPNDENDLIWTTTNGRPMRGTGTGGVTYQLQTLLRKAGLPKRDFYNLRHHAASWLLAANGGNLYEVQKVLGHSSHNMTANIYGHLVEELSTATARAAEALLEKTGAPAARTRTTVRARRARDEPAHPAIAV